MLTSKPTTFVSLKYNVQVSPTPLEICYHLRILTVNRSAFCGRKLYEPHSTQRILTPVCVVVVAHITVCLSNGIAA